jgi:L-asparaginase
VIAIVFTGGTISMRIDPTAGGAVPTLTGAKLVDLAPGIQSIAQLEIHEWATMPGAHLTVDQMWALRGYLADLVARPDIDGVVVTQGTDTIEETSYLTHRALVTPKPIVFTGAMRTSEDLGWDGPSNLSDSVRVAASPDAVGLGVLVVFNSRIYTASDVTKVHTHMLDAFDSPGLGPLGVLDEGRVLFRRSLPICERAARVPEKPATPVDIVYAYAGADGRLLDALRAEGRGVVVAALGRGNTPLAMYEAIRRWIADGKPVVITSRAARGRVGPTYGFPGGGRSLSDAGAIFAGARRPAQARIDLMLALGSGLRGDELIAAFLT